MTIKEFLNQYYADKTQFLWQVDQMLFNTKLLKEFGLWGDADEVLEFINLILRHYNDASMHPDRVVELCSAIGFDTTEQITDFMALYKTSSLNLIGLFNYLFPKLNRDYFTSTISYNEVYQFLDNTIPEAIVTLPGPIGHTQDNIIITDSVYKLIPYDKFEYVLHKCPSERFRYISEERDCDDFTRIMKSWLSEQRLGNLSLGGVHANLFKDNTFKYAHSFLIALTIKDNGEKVIRFGDGQDDSLIWDWGEEPTLPNVNKMHISKILI